MGVALRRAGGLIVRWRTCAALVVFAAVLPQTVVGATAHKCQEVLATELQTQGVSWDSLQGIDWVEEKQLSSPGNEIVSGYQFYAVPASCTQGRLVARLDVDCRITQIYTRRGCVAGNVRSR